MLVFFIVSVVLLTALFEKIYHKVFSVIYISFGSMVKELVTCFIISFCIVMVVFNKAGLFE